MQKILQLKHVKKTYGRGEAATQALRGISLDVLEGEFLGIMGPSGSGKSTLLNCLASMTPITEGEIIFRGNSLSGYSGKTLAEYRSRDVGILFQDFQLLDNLTGEENIALPLLIRGESLKTAESRLKRLADNFQIAALLKKFPAEMSGGEKQRIAASRAFIADPLLILADEPTGALDSKNARILLDQLAALQKEAGKTIVMVSHDPSAAAYCDRVLYLRDGLLFHELRRRYEQESQNDFYHRILEIIAQASGGPNDVLS